MLIAALFLYPIINMMALPVVLFSLFTTVYIDSHYTHISMLHNLRSTYTATLHGLATRLFEANGLQRNFAFTMEYLRQQHPIPQWAGTTDVYSYQQTYLIASGNNWRPRPIFQSYSVFNAKLAEINAGYLLGKDAPDTIIFNIEPIDQRLPSLEDGASWRILLHNYEPVGEFKNTVLLHKKSEPLLITSHVLSTERHQLNERVQLPNIKHPLFAELVIEPTWWGRLALFFFKTSPLEINLELKNGDNKTYRLLGAVSKSGFLLSPLVEDNEEFAELYQPNSLLAKEVRAFTIATKGNTQLFWQSTYDLRLKT